MPFAMQCGNGEIVECAECGEQLPESEAVEDCWIFGRLDTWPEGTPDDWICSNCKPHELLEHEEPQTGLRT